MKKLILLALLTSSIAIGQVTKITLKTGIGNILDKVVNTIEVHRKEKGANYSLVVNRKLVNSDIWQRVSNNRFECKFLRLAVEIRNNQYFLIEMDGDKLVLAHDFDYNNIRNEIEKLTLNSF